MMCEAITHIIEHKAIRCNETCHNGTTLCRMHMSSYIHVPVPSLLCSRINDPVMCIIHVIHNHTIDGHIYHRDTIIIDTFFDITEDIIMDILITKTIDVYTVGDSGHIRNIASNVVYDKPNIHSIVTKYYSIKTWMLDIVLLAISSIVKDFQSIFVDLVQKFDICQYIDMKTKYDTTIQFTPVGIMHTTKTICSNDDARTFFITSHHIHNDELELEGISIMRADYWYLRLAVPDQDLIYYDNMSMDIIDIRHIHNAILARDSDVYAQLVHIEPSMVVDTCRDLLIQRRIQSIKWCLKQPCTHTPNFIPMLVEGLETGHIVLDDVILSGIPIVSIHHKDTLIHRLVERESTSVIQNLINRLPNVLLTVRLEEVLHPMTGVVSTIATTPLEIAIKDCRVRVIELFVSQIVYMDAIWHLIPCAVKYFTLQNKASHVILARVYNAAMTTYLPPPIYSSSMVEHTDMVFNLFEDYIPPPYRVYDIVTGLLLSIAIQNGSEHR